MTAPTPFKKLFPPDIRKPFDCGDDDLNEYFLKDSAGHSLYLLSVTYSLETETETVAFFSVLNDRIQKEGGNKGLFAALKIGLPESKQYNSYPAVKVGRFGVNKTHQRTGIGTDVMNFIKMFFVDKQQKTGCRFITIDAYNTACVIDFYKMRIPVNSGRHSDSFQAPVPI